LFNAIRQVQESLRFYAADFINAYAFFLVTAL